MCAVSKVPWDVGSATRCVSVPNWWWTWWAPQLWVHYTSWPLPTNQLWVKCQKKYVMRVIWRDGERTPLQPTIRQRWKKYRIRGGLQKKAKGEFRSPYFLLANTSRTMELKGITLHPEQWSPNQCSSKTQPLAKQLLKQGQGHVILSTTLSQKTAKRNHFCQCSDPTKSLRKLYDPKLRSNFFKIINTHFSKINEHAYFQHSTFLNFLILKT